MEYLMPFNERGRMNYRGSLIFIASLIVLLSSEQRLFPDNLPKVDIAFTYGPAGPTHDVKFIAGETVFGILRISGLNSNKPFSCELETQIEVRDTSGNTLLSTKPQHNVCFQLLGDGVVVIPFEIEPKSDTQLIGDFAIHAIATDLRTKMQGQTSCIISWHKQTGLTATNYRFVQRADRTIPAGPVLAPGGEYAMTCDIIGLEPKNGSIGFTGRLSGRVNQSDNDTCVLHYSLTDSVSRYSTAPNSAILTAPIYTNESGQLTLHSVIEDANSEQTFESDIPITSMAPNWSEPNPPTRGRLQADIVFTQGELGRQREGKFHSGETVYVDIAIAGLQEHKARFGGCFAMTMKFLNSEGKVIISKSNSGHENIYTLSGESVIHRQLSLELNDKVSQSEKYWLLLIIKDIETNNEISVRKPMTWTTCTQMTAMGHRMTWDAEGKYPAGPVLSVGQTYCLNCDLTKYTVKDYAIDISHSVKAFTEDGQPIAGTELVLDHKRALSVAEKLNDQLPLTMQVSLNRPGKFLLRSTITDNLSGQTYTSDMPVEVVSPFQFVKEKATIEN
ncbi:hypothetical protein [Blastopirellula marina]|uniref:Uncharacterized protein n=1 Tax=Blastopirellula marina TaxID=124 RepID=A0A2S8G8H3_9BACT|nr:hypothetical protein [Blastopirellula marina]PQO40727.1 hypothetical protein C5Y98_05785 [Blastopirellula marina]PTL45687.1 hypothetical protein C5Y97_05785 [Blastopirellula marina]